MEQVTAIGLDIAKHVFHAHGVDDRGRMLFSKRVGRSGVLAFFAPAAALRGGAGGVRRRPPLGP